MWGIGGMMRRLWKNSDDGFDRPVGLHLWRPIGVELQRLNEDISTEYKDLATATASQNTGITRWVKCITDSLSSATKHGNLYLQAQYITSRLQESLNDLKERFTTQSNEDSTYKQLKTKILDMKIRIMECQILVSTYCQYWISIEAYVKGELKWKECELSVYLKDSFRPKIACEICQHLGVTLKGHLAYVDIKDILGDDTDTTRKGLLFLDINEKLTLQVIVQTYQQEKENDQRKEENDNNDVSVKRNTQIQMSLLKLRACFEGSEDEE